VETYDGIHRPIPTMRRPVAKNEEPPFSKRYHFSPADPPVTVWDDAPEALRVTVLQVAVDECYLSPSTLRGIVCCVLRARPDPSNWSEYPNIWGEVEDLVYSCDWYKVYDIIEAIGDTLDAHPPPLHALFETKINECLAELGIGWQLKKATVQARGDRAYEEQLTQAQKALAEAKLPTAASELAEALRDISRRPEPDLSGAVQHAMAALEAVARAATGDPRGTLGEIIKRNPKLLPRPLDDATAKIWGYASEQARHGREDRQLTRAESELAVGLAAAVSGYILHKTQHGDGGTGD